MRNFKEIPHEFINLLCIFKFLHNFFLGGFMFKISIIWKPLTNIEFY